MTDLEQRLRRDLREIAARIDHKSVRPLRVPERKRVPGLARWLAPVMAMAAVIGVIAGVRLATAPGPTTTAAAAPMPPHYVTVVQTAPPADTTTAIVHDSATGAVLATVRLPRFRPPELTSKTPLSASVAITAAADDRTFVITQDVGATTNVANPAFAQSDLARFYLLSVAPDGRSASLRSLPLRLPPSPYSGILNFNHDVALSPDGTRLALVLCEGVSHCSFNGIRVITLATDEARDWTMRVTSGVPGHLSWAGDDHVAFWLGAPQRSSYRLLDVAGAGGSLLAAPVIPVKISSGDAMVTPDGRAMIGWVTTNIIPEGNGNTTVVTSIVELSARTGRQLQVLYSWTQHGVSRQATHYITAGNCAILSLGSAGVWPLVSCTVPNKFGILENGKITPLPASPSPGWNGLEGPGSGAYADAAW